MNKFLKLFFAMFALCVATTACDDDDDSDGTVPTNSLSVTASVGTAANAVSVSGYDLRVIAELYEEKSDGSYASTPSARSTAFITATSVTANSTAVLTLDAPAAKYAVVAWCDYVKTGSEADCAYSTVNLNNVSVPDYTYSAVGYKTELRQAFAGKTTGVDLTNGATTAAVTTRLVTIKYGCTESHSYSTAEKIVVKYITNNSDTSKYTGIASGYNVLTSSVNGTMITGGTERYYTQSCSGTSFTFSDYILTDSDYDSEYNLPKISIDFYDSSNGLLGSTTLE